MKMIHWLAIILVILGGVNWGLMALADFNLINAMVVYVPLQHVARIVYGLIGISAIYVLINVKRFNE